LETVFKLSSFLVLPCWALMLFLPRWRWTERLMRSPWVAAGPALLYACLMLPRLAEHAPLLLRPEFRQIAGLLGSPEGTALAWAHFLAFDLLVGRWVYLDGRRRGLSAWLVAPALFLTLLVGPVGFLVYLSLRALAGRAGSEGAASEATFAG
jgi:hypothetical protein